MSKIMAPIMDIILSATTAFATEDGDSRLCSVVKLSRAYTCIRSLTLSLFFQRDVVYLII